jgi:hypothetical protein
MNKCVYNYTMLNLIPTIKHNHSIVKYNTPKLKQQDLKNLITTSWNICGNNEYKNIYQINKISEVMWKIILAKAKILGMPNVNFISSWHAFAEFFENEHNRSVFRELIHLFNPINKNPTNGGSSSSDSDSPNSSPDSDYSSPDCSPISSPETNPNGSPNGYSGDNEGGDEGEDSRTEYLDQIDDIDDNRQFVTLHGAAKLKVKTFATLALIFIIIFAGSGTTFFFVESGLLDRLTNLFSLTNIAMAAMTTCAISASPWFIPQIVQFHQSAERQSANTNSLVRHRDMFLYSIFRMITYIIKKLINIGMNTNPENYWNTILNSIAKDYKKNEVNIRYDGVQNRSLGRTRSPDNDRPDNDRPDNDRPDNGSPTQRPYL